ncbi:MAG: indole-3-glycerol phosphate synthase TrpC [Nitrospirota bacterium]
MAILSDIIARKRERLKEAKAVASLRELKAKIEDLEETRDFKQAIRRSPGEKIKFIAEIKKASPSKGIIRKGFDHITIAGIYEEKGVDAVSVLTEEDFFHGNLSFIPHAKEVITRPVLRKDFIFEEYQVYESRAYGADAILLIASILDKNQAAEFLHMAKELGLSSLFEIHDHKELEMAMALNCDIIGINNRNLETMKVDLGTTFELKKELSPGKIIVSESGIKSREEVALLEDAGIDAILVGTVLMEAEDIGKKIDELTGRV